MAFDKRLLEIIACPVCKGKLILTPQQDGLVCCFDRLRFPIVEGIPVLLESEAINLTSEELEGIKNS